MKLLQYRDFFKLNVLRKQQELVGPKFLPISSIVMPRLSEFHFLPDNDQAYGPDTSEAFISNFPGDIYINFKLLFEPYLGKGHTIAFDKPKAIKAYRGSHFNYNWTREIRTVYNREIDLVVNSYGLIEKGWTYRPSLFVNFEKKYNQLRNVLNGINESAHLKKRKQFFRLDMPINFPSFVDFQIDYEHYKKSFVNGLPVINKQAIRKTKAENCYWLLDWYAFLIGDYEHSLFSVLDDEALEETHLIFTFNSKCLIVNLGLIKRWFETLRTKPTNRLNAVKRFYLALMNLTRGGVPELEILESESDNDKESKSLDSGEKQTPARAIETQSKDAKKTVLGEAPNLDPASVPRSILDVFGTVEGSTGTTDPSRPPERNGDDNEEPASWDSEVDDSLLEEETTETTVELNKDVFDTPTKGIELALNELAKDGVLTVAEQNFFIRKGQRFESIMMDNGQTLEEYVEIPEKELKEIGGKIEGNFTTILDESLLNCKARALKYDYPKKFLHRDVARMFLGVQNAGVCLPEYSQELVRNIEGAYDVFNFQLHPVRGGQSTGSVRIPHVEDDGTFMVDGVKRHLQFQRMEIPIRKINNHKVALTSYYDTKLIVGRSELVADDYKPWLYRQIADRVKAKAVKVKLGNVWDRSIKSPRLYSILASKYKSITVGDMVFDFDYSDLLEKDPSVSKYAKAEKFIVGMHNGQPLLLDSYGNVFNGVEEIGTIEGIMGISIKSAPIEQVKINIQGYQYPIGVVLSYYFGFDNLLKVLKTTSRSVPIDQRPKLADDEYAIKFSDEYLVLNKRERLSSMILGGLVKLSNISNFSRSDLNNNGVWFPLMADPKVKPAHFKEMKNLFDLFIDPITKDELVKYKYPTSFHYLLIEAVKLLLTDYTRHEVELEEQRIVGYERFAGQIYGELCKSIRKYQMKGDNRKHVVEVNPEAVIMAIITDTSVNAVEEVGPVHQAKDQEEVTFGGNKGRSEVSMVKRTRGQLKSYKGVISEANKDSGKVGYVSALVSDPRIGDFRGNIDTKEKNGNAGLGSVTFQLLYGGNHDDAKRVSFASNQASQAVSAENYTPNILRTGYDNVLAHRTSELYSKVAKDEGTVTKVTDDVIQVTYKDGTVDAYGLGLTIGEASGEFHRHTKVTDLKVGDKFNKGDVIGWDRQWFERDLFCPGQVAWKCGKMVRIALTEDSSVFEDSLVISRAFAKECITPYLKRNVFMVNAEDVITMYAKLGMDVVYDTILCDIEDSSLENVENTNPGFEGIQRIGVRQIKSVHHGKIVNIDVRYNAPLETMSNSVKSFVQTIDRDLARKAKLTNSPVVNSSVSTSLNVKKQSVPYGKVKIVVYIESLDGSVSADKYVVGNQMKGTVGEVMEHELKTLSGLVVDVKFSFKSLLNRMVLSLRNKMCTCELAIHFTKKAINVYDTGKPE